MNKDKADRADNLLSRLLKDSETIISKLLTFLVNISLGKGTFPQEWKSVKVTPLHKSDDPTNRNNYRSISVLPTLPKILERVVPTQIMEYLETHGLLSKNQFGCRTKRSTELAATLFIDNIWR